MCALNQSKALYEISTLLKELENVEELYPSGRLLSLEYPLYGSTAFTDRIKAMCLWYNVTCLLQLKIDIIGHMLVSLGSKGLPWPTWPAWPRHNGKFRASHHRVVFLFNYYIFSILSGFPGEGHFQEDHTKVRKASFDQFSVFEDCPTSDPSREVQSSSVLSTKKKPLKREKSRVQFFLESGPTANNRTGDRHRMEDSPSESWKSEYSGTDLRKSLKALMQQACLNIHYLFDS